MGRKCSSSRRRSTPTGWCLLLWKPMHLQSVFAGSDCVSLEEKPVGTDLYERGLCLPSDLHIDDDDMKLIIDTVRKCF